MPRNPVAGPKKTLAEVMAELRPIWEAWAASIGDHEGWRIGALYGRESHEDSLQGFLPPTQLHRMLAAAAERHAWIPWEHVFFDQITGRTDQRDGFQALHTLARTGAFTIVINFHSSRWARNAMLSRRYKEELRSRGIEVLQLNVQVDVATPEGRFMERSVENIDEYQSDSTGFFVSQALRTKVVEEGLPVGTLPELFVKQPDGSIVPRAALAAIVLDGIAMYLRNETGERVGFGDLAEWARDNGHRTPAGRPLSDEWWRNTLANPMICGYVAFHRKAMRAKGGAELKKGAFTGIIEREVFDRITAIRVKNTRRAGRPPANQTYVLSGAVCGACGGQVTACGSGRMRCRAAQQHGQCSEASIVASDLENESGSWLARVIELGAKDETRLEALITQRMSRRPDIQELERLRSARRKLHDRYELDPEMTKSEYARRVAALTEQIRLAEAQDDNVATRRAIELVRDFPRLYAHATADQRRAIWQLCFDEWVIESGTLMAVRPKAETAPLFAAACLQLRSRPDSNRRSRP